MDLKELIRNGAEVEEKDKPKTVDFSEAPGLFVKTILLPKAESLVPQHSHKTGHLTMLAVGEMYVWKDGILDKRYKAPAAIYIAPGVKHTFMTVVDNCLLYCVHRLEEGEQEPGVLEEHQFPKFV